MKYTAEEVREWAAFAQAQGKLYAPMKGAHEPWEKLEAMLTAYADLLERIKADERAVPRVTERLVQVAENARVFVLNDAPKHPRIGEQELRHIAMRSALLAVWPNPSAQAEVTDEMVTNVVNAYVFGGADSFGCVRAALESIVLPPAQAARDAYGAGLAEQAERLAAQPAQLVDVEKVAWSLVFSERTGVNASTTFGTERQANDYADKCAVPDACDPNPTRPRVVALYTAPPIDFAAVREVIAHLRSFRSNTPPTWAHLDDAADKLEAALQEGE